MAADPDATPAVGHDPAVDTVIAALGTPGSVDLVPTPALLCDIDLLARNIESM